MVKNVFLAAFIERLFVFLTFGKFFLTEVMQYCPVSD